MKETTNTIINLIKDQTDFPIEVRESTDFDTILFLYKRNGVESVTNIFIPKLDPCVTSYIIETFAQTEVPQDLIFSCTLVINKFNDWLKYLSCGLSEKDNLLCFRCVKTIHQQLTTDELEATFKNDFRRVIQTCHQNTEHIISKATRVAKSIDFKSL